MKFIYLYGGRISSLSFRIKSFAKNRLPSRLMAAFREFRRGHLQIDGEYANWDSAALKCTGYDSEHILAKVLDATIKVQKGEASYERDSVVFEDIEYAWPVLAGLMWVAAINNGKLNVLDFGGALGSSYFQNRKFFNDLQEIRWNIVEQSHYVKVGREFIETDILRFYPSIDSCLLESNPNVILLSSVLQYLPDYNDVIEKINNSNVSILIIDRTPFCDASENKICIQNVPKSIYSASYPMRIFSEEIFIDLLNDWEIIAKNLSPEGSIKSNSGLTINFHGFVLRRKNAKST